MFVKRKKCQIIPAARHPGGACHIIWKIGVLLEAGKQEIEKTNKQKSLSYYIFLDKIIILSKTYGNYYWAIRSK